MKNFFARVQSIFRPYHLAHAVYSVMGVVLIGVLTGHFWTGYAVVVGVYLSREITWTEIKRPLVNQYNPMNWSGHDRIQTLYLLVLGGLAAYCGELLI